jgi:cyclic pyranopterin phosphate synthase
MSHTRIIPIATAREFPPLATDAIVADRLQRPLRDLRISVTDRCNLRCTYCMPRTAFAAGHAFLPRSEILSFEEIERLARAFVSLGVQKIRLTGGEPLLRHDIERLIEKLAGLQTLDGDPVEVALTTNGVLLEKKARELKAAGLARVTVSLDGLSQHTFRQMSDSEIEVSQVLRGIAAAQEVGLTPLKVNMVVRRGVNEHEILSMAEHFRYSGIVLRFIEYMDVGNTNAWKMDEVVTAREIVAALSARYPLQQIDPNYNGEVAERWRYADGSGEVGVIASVTQAFCQSCTRARLSTDGKLYTCLFADRAQLDLRQVLRQGMDESPIAAGIAGCWAQRDERYSQQRHAATVARNKIEMSYIGG